MKNRVSPYGQVVKTLPSQGGVRGSIPLKGTSEKNHLCLNNSGDFL